MKRLLFINHGSNFGGSGIACLNIVRAIDKSKYDITIYCAYGQGEISNQLKKEGYKVLDGYGSPVTYCHFSGGSKSIISPYYWSNLFKIKKDKKKIESIIRELKPDCVVLNSMTLSWIGKLVKSINSNIMTYCFHRETYVKEPFGLRTYLLKKQLTKYSDKIAFISEYDLKETYPDGKLGYVIPDCVDIQRYCDLKKSHCQSMTRLDNSKVNILFLGGISKLKGTELLLKAVDSIDDEDISLVILGGDELNRQENSNFFSWHGMCKDAEFTKILNVFRNLKHPERVVLAPQSSSVETYYGACDFVVFPSTKPHQAMPIFEAGAAKRPILVSAFQCTNEYLKNGENGFTFRPNSYRDLADKIVSIKNMLGIEAMFEVVENNYRRTREKHSIDVFVQMVKDFLNYE